MAGMFGFWKFGNFCATFAKYSSEASDPVAFAMRNVKPLNLAFGDPSVTDAHEISSCLGCMEPCFRDISWWLRAQVVILVEFLNTDIAIPHKLSFVLKTDMVFRTAVFNRGLREVEIEDEVAIKFLGRDVGAAAFPFAFTFSRL